jgi:hypothetical protein
MQDMKLVQVLGTKKKGGEICRRQIYELQQTNRNVCNLYIQALRYLRNSCIRELVL